MDFWKRMRRIAGLVVVALWIAVVVAAAITQDEKPAGAPAACTTNCL